MPLVNVHLIEGVFTRSRSASWSASWPGLWWNRGREPTNGMWVIVEEVKSGDRGIGGNGLITADVHALQGQAPATVPG